jgi:hypothetical protein
MQTFCSSLRVRFPRKQSFVRPNPAPFHVFVDFAYRQTKEPSYQDPVTAIKDHPTSLPICPRPRVYPKLPGCLPN